MKHTQRRQRGATLVEVLVTMVILAIGLFGLIGLHGRVQLLQLESYQRAQALMLLDDMANRLTNNRYDAAAYDTGAPVGTGDDCAADYAGVTRRLSDTREWCEALQGAGELSSGGDSVGAMIGGRGCIDDLGNRDFLVTVAWQGMAPISAPPANITCGADLYDGGEDSPCTDDLCRRVVTTLVHIPDLT